MFLRSHHKSATIYLRGHKEIETPHNPHSHSKLGTDSKQGDHNLTRMSSSWMKSWMKSWNWTFFPTQHMKIKTESKKRRNRERRNVRPWIRSLRAVQILSSFFFGQSQRKSGLTVRLFLHFSLYSCVHSYGPIKNFFL